MENIPSYWVSIQDSMDLRVGDPNDTSDRDRLKAQSPLFGLAGAFEQKPTVMKLAALIS